MTPGATPQLNGLDTCSLLTRRGRTLGASGSSGARQAEHLTARPCSVQRLRVFRPSSKRPTTAAAPSSHKPTATVINDGHGRLAETATPATGPTSPDHSGVIG